MSNQLCVLLLIFRQIFLLSFVHWCCSEAQFHFSPYPRPPILTDCMPETSQVLLALLTFFLERMKERTKKN